MSCHNFYWVTYFAEMERAEDCETAKVSAYKWKNRNLYIKQLTCPISDGIHCMCIWFDCEGERRQKFVIFIARWGFRGS